MSKNTLKEEYRYVSKNTKEFTRAPIHRNDENEDEIIDEEEEEEENFSNIYQRKTLYPDLGKEVRELHGKTKSKESQQTHKHGTTKSKGEDRKKAKQLITSEKSDSDTPIFKYMIYLLAVIVAAIVGFFACTPKETSDMINVTKLVDDMQSHFQDQQSATFRVLNLALKKVVNDNPEPSAPAIFTVVVSKGAEKTASDFSIHLANALAPGNFVSINESQLWRNNPEQLKLKIDNDIKSKLEKEILNVVIVDRLNDIPIDAALVFHGFCDHESAPYKRAVYLFIVHLGISIPKNSAPRDIDAVAMQSLRHIWRTSTDDVVDSLITRITVNVVSII